MLQQIIQSSDLIEFGAEFIAALATETAAASAHPDTPPVRSSDLRAALDRYMSRIRTGKELTTEFVAQFDTWKRKRTIEAALFAAAVRAVRFCKRNTMRSTLLLMCIALRSDNRNARCVDGAQRLARLMGCGEDVVRDTINALVAADCLRCETRSGETPALWLPYAAELACASAHELYESLSPPRAGHGRPRKIQQKTPGVIGPGFNEKPRVSPGQTPGVQVENPGPMTPDTTTSYQSLVPPRRGAKRFFEDLDDTEREALRVAAHEYVRGRPGWTDDFLTTRWKAFCNHQTATGCQSYNWPASLENWLDNPKYQPRGGASSPLRSKPRRTIEEVYGDGSQRDEDTR